LKALSYLENMKHADEDADAEEMFDYEQALRDEVKSVQVMLLLNVAACCLKQGDYDEAVAHCNAVLKKQPENPKALYRRGVAQGNLGLLAEANADLRHVLRLTDKTDTATLRDVRRELEKVKHKVEEDRGLAKRMLGQERGLPSAHMKVQHVDDACASAEQSDERVSMLPPL